VNNEGEIQWRIRIRELQKEKEKRKKKGKAMALIARCTYIRNRPVIAGGHVDGWEIIYRRPIE
jgi:hypothetical protein